MTVIEGQIYRSAQPSASDIATWSKRLKLRSIVNLRGEGPLLKDEMAAAELHGFTTMKQSSILKINSGML